MKKILLSISAALLLYGCQQDETSSSESYDNAGVRFFAETEEFGGDSRTALGPNNSVVWSVNDELAIFAASTAAGKYRVTDESAGSTNGEFEYVPVEGNFVSGSELEKNIAIYPYEKGLVCSNGSSETSFVIRNVTLTEVQHYKANSFPEESFPMAAVTRSAADMVLNFKNTGGAIRLLLKGSIAVKSITLTGNDSERLAGECDVTVYTDGSVPSVQMSDNAMTSITLDCGEGVQLNETTATQFMLSLPPTEFRNGFTFLVTDTDGGSATLKATRANTVNRSKVLNMPELTIVTEAGVTDLSSNGTANCYIVQKPGTYMFKATKGNSQESVGDVRSTEIVWTTFGTETAPVKGDLIESSEFADDYITFTVPKPFKEGNALIAAKDAKGTILWSWHIWMVEDEIVEQTFINNAGVVMDRNLGATSATIEDNGCFGLLYQWGRKDPFIGAYRIFNEKDMAQSFGTSWSATQKTSSTGTIEYAIKNPTTFIKDEKDGKDWLYGTSDNTRWSSEKTIYDPCPAGWRVPDGGPDGLWGKAGFKKTITNPRSQKGMVISETYCTPESWWPAAGQFTSSIESINRAGMTGAYWSATSKSVSECYRLTFNFTGYSVSNKPIEPTLPSGSNTSQKSYGHSVRCCKE